MEYPNLILSFNKRGRCLVIVIIIGVYPSFALVVFTMHSKLMCDFQFSRNEANELSSSSVQIGVYDC